VRGGLRKLGAHAWRSRASRAASYAIQQRCVCVCVCVCVCIYVAVTSVESRLLRHTTVVSLSANAVKET